MRLLSSGGLDGFQIGRHRRLGIDHDTPSTGQVDCHVGAQAPALVRAHALLFRKVDVLGHAGHLRDPLELDFAPAAACVGLAQGVDKTVGLTLECGKVRVDQGLHLLMERTVGFAARRLQLLVLPFQLGQGLAQRLDEFVHRLPALVEIVARQLLLLLEALFGQLQQ